MMIGAPTLAISPQKVCSFIAKAREFGAADAISDYRLNGDGDAPIGALVGHADCPTFSELASFIDELTENEQIDLVVLTWLGRGDGTLSELNDLREEAGYFHNKRTASYLLAKPMLVDHLKEGLAQLGCDCEAVGAVAQDKQLPWTYEFKFSAKAQN
jgi:uncharacterized protein DUF3775